ncbi:response regulator receiver modulated diguanylate cyclase [Treponema primitia ZAS-2]|uniref:diguanylate cyclase n=1 Tax=Treponema primitia (strain ATCC BAA-887 / DSM 12427 / ZAS-2) TaxID=545694 RepID=F5YJI7_TREPZ|nr:diguanylate cyclase [Treponema primitia]AEF84446.1 response regulator receiver modulated diguanylate cyclase [Treponema primitia ZAS-2]
MESDPEFRLLIIDDETSNLMVLNQILSSEYTVLTAKSGKEGLERAAADRPDLILLDVLMPDISGFETLVALKQSSETMQIPVIFITGLSDEADEEKGFRLGAVDYITKPFKNAIVQARVRTHSQIVRQIRTIEQLGLIDGLTNIPNRRCFDDRIALEWRRAVREKKPISFLMMDVDKFKTYNDTYGHPQGDTLLKTIAGIFKAAAKRSTDLAARLGGEEFGILLPDTDMKAALVVAEKIRSAVEAARVPTADGKTITTATISIGAVSLVPDDTHKVEEFLSTADGRLYTAKNTGRNRVCAE